MKICNNCKHCKTRFLHSEYAYDYLCRKHFTTDRITGDRIYSLCSDINTDGRCPEYRDSIQYKLQKLFFHPTPSSP